MVNQSLDRVYGALADATRRGMLERLRRGPLSVSDLGEPLGMTLAGVGKHVAVLEGAGLVRTRKTGRVRVCELHGAAYTEAAAWIDEQRTFWEERLDRVQSYLEGGTVEEGS